MNRLYIFLSLFAFSQISLSSETGVGYKSYRAGTKDYAVAKCNPHLELKKCKEEVKNCDAEFKNQGIKNEYRRDCKLETVCKTKVAKGTWGAIHGAGYGLYDMTVGLAKLAGSGIQAGYRGAVKIYKKQTDKEFAKSEELKELEAFNREAKKYEHAMAACYKNNFIAQPKPGSLEAYKADKKARRRLSSGERARRPFEKCQNEVLQKYVIRENREKLVKAIHKVKDEVKSRFTCYNAEGRAHMLTRGLTWAVGPGAAVKGGKAVYGAARGAKVTEASAASIEVAKDMHTAWLKGHRASGGGSKYKEVPVGKTEGAEQALARFQAEGYQGLKLQDGVLVQNINQEASKIVPSLSYKLNGGPADDYVLAFSGQNFKTTADFEKGAAEVHNVWMKHNSWQKEASPHLFQSYSNLSAAEKLKDVDQMAVILKATSPKSLESAAYTKYRESLIKEIQRSSP